ncbi:MAG: 23S rRNA (guanosine(2251)-2'-O)-methyltransferase RlmB [Gammaproteobacteria bacterium]
MSEARRLGGIHAVRAALDYTPQKIVRAWLDQHRQDQRIREIAERLSAGNIPVESVTRKRLDALCQEHNHQGVVIEIQLPREHSEKVLFDRLEAQDSVPFYLVLDQVQDPYNLGACLRSADAAGIHGIVLPKDRAVGMTPTVCKVASGAAEFVPLYRVTNLCRTLQHMKKSGLWLIGADAQATQTVFEADLKGPLALVIGAEGHGLRRLTREQCDLLLRLPMAGKIENLNLSVAAGIFLFEAVRQRGSA